MDSDIQWAAAQKVARLSTLARDGSPHIVPIVFVLDGNALYSPVDGKPKRGGRLAREANLARDPRASVLIDHYDDDWQQLAWLRLDGEARVIDAGAARASLEVLLRAKYQQYATTSLFADPPRVLYFTWRRVSRWRARPDAAMAG